MINILECKNLNKTFGKTNVLKDISFILEENKIYGLLGRNGVGKTTLLNLICNQVTRDSGEIKLFDEEIFENSKAMENICFIKEKDLPVEGYKIKKIFKIASILYKNWDEEYKDYLIKEFNLDVNKKYENLSRGNKSIVGAIIGLASRAKLTIFDEPSLGLDAAARYKFYNILLEDYEKNPRTIILSTHLIDEVSNLFEEIILLTEGKLMLKEDVHSLMEKAYFLNGREDNMKKVIEGKKVIHKEGFGATTILGIFDSLTREEVKMLKDNNVEVSSMPLQKLFIYLTENVDIKEGKVNGCC
ncbi:ABC transporter ATP-binding protein [Tissierella sp. MSJ-40]|uniref:ABC transporter ATP-binding protein n=1 Tax=Tissierella simiarum TaxID=2841534 RepID=A0ABS6E8T2_9FIRM|nr:ABC transporter ATP-binding protein [Tissierella simiarum]MBU5438835.1 ABC transporter ATP-binding protein [Tissierella simiarum]